MVFFKGDVAAPISGERVSRPERESQSVNANRRANELKKRRAWDELPAHRAGPFRDDHRPPAESDRKAMGQHGRRALSLDDGLGSQCGEQPDDYKGEPASDDDMAGDGGHRFWRGI